MAQSQTTGPVQPVRARLQPAGSAPLARPDVSPRAMVSPAAVLVALALGGVLAYGLPAVDLTTGADLGLGAVSDRLTLGGDGWVTTLSWFGAIVAAVAAFAFPRSERFIQAIAVSAGSLVAMAVPYFVWSHLSLVDDEAAGLGLGLALAWACFGVAAAMPWLGLFAWDRTRPALGRDWSKWIFLLPAVAWVFLLTIFPLLYALTTSRYAFRNGRISRSVGWENYRRLFAEDVSAGALGGAVVVAGIAAAVAVALGVGWTLLNERAVTRRDVARAAHLVPLVAVPAVLVYLAQTVLRDPLGPQLVITFIFVAGAVGTQMLLGFLIALVLNRELRGRGVLRAVMTLPLFATPIALGYLARSIFYEEGGPINAGLGSLGLGQPPWLSDPQWARLATIIVDVWQWTPFVFIIALAGLQGLSQEVIEAAEVDGATGWQVLRSITLPLMAPILWLIFLLRAIDSFKVFDIPSGLTLGGPGRATEYYSLFNYRTARKFFSYGEAAAQAFLLLFVVMVLVSLLWGRIKHVYEDEGVRA